MYQKVKYDKTCAYCGCQFEAHDRRKMFCSRRCRDISYKLSKGIKVNANINPYTRICKVCGKEFETFREADVCCSHECTVINRNKRERKKSNRSGNTWQEYNNIRKEKAKQNKEKKEIEKAWYRAIHTVSRECIICGSLFYCLDTSKKKTCSKECSNKYSNIKRDKRIPKEQIVDADINVNRLFKRDKGKCWICGGKCDFNDIAISAKGNEYPGDNYPEIEHVIPISRGGLHSWDNVRLAHHKCNAQKGANLYPYTPLAYEFAYKEKKQGTPAKKTAQYTLDGKLIKIWNSTGEIERKTGLKSKHIQGVCRRYKSNTGNAYGYHWEYVT